MYMNLQCSLMRMTLAITQENPRLENIRKKQNILHLMRLLTTFDILHEIQNKLVSFNDLLTQLCCFASNTEQSKKRTIEAFRITTL